MSNNSLNLIRRIYKIILSVSIIISGICLIIGCVSIYFSGEGYSSDIVGKTFSKINIPVFLCLTLIVCDVIWELISPSSPKTKRTKKIDHSAQHTKETADKKLRITRLVVLGLAIVVLILGAIFGGYADVLTKAVNICTECIGLG